MKKKVAIVTGGNRGIGLELCRQLSENNMTVFLCSRDLKKGEEAKEKLSPSTSQNIIPIQLDVNSDESVLMAYTTISHYTKHVDVLINNAGIFIDPDYPALKTELKSIEQTFQTNTLGPLRVTLTMLPLMKKNGGHIINISSGKGQLEDMEGGSLGYRLSKTALNCVTKTLSSELSPFNIQINAVCPGWVKTEMGGPNASLSVDQAVSNIIWLITYPHGKSGSFFSSRKVIPW